MGKSVRKYRKNRAYEYLEPEKATAYDIHDGKATTHNPDGSYYHYNSDLLSSSQQFLSPDDLAPGTFSSFCTVMVLVATCVGPAVVALPYVFLEGGFIMTIVLLLLFALVTYYSTVCLVHLSVTHGVYSFHGIARLAFGWKGAFIVACLQFIVSIGLLLTYFIIVFHDLRILLAHLFGMDFDASGEAIAGKKKLTLVSKVLADRMLFAELLTLLVIIPLCLFASNYMRLKRMSIVVVFSLLIASLYVMAQAHSLHIKNVHTKSQGFHADYIAVPATVFRAFGVLATVFACQHHSFHVFYAMENRSVVAFTRIALYVLLLVLFLAFSIGIGGYVSFLSGTHSDVIHNYYNYQTTTSTTDRSPSAAYWILVPISALLCIPHEVVVTHHSCQFLCQLWRTWKSDHNDPLFRSQPPGKDYVYTATPITGASPSPSPSSSHSPSPSPTPSTEEEKPIRASENVVDWSEGNRRRNWYRCLITALLLLILAQVALLIDSEEIGTILSVTGGIAALGLSFVLPAACHLKLELDSESRQRDNVGGKFFTITFPIFTQVIGVVGAVACVITNIAHS